MIQAKELRIGNLINFHKIKNGIQSVSKCSIIQIINTPEYYSYIPLTEEWLFKFGFLKIGDFKTYEKKYNFLREIKYISIEGEFGFSVSVHYRNAFAMITIIHSVHQLQNLYFSLTGEELTVSN